ncbi:hypothetical protein [Paraoerskovia marina]|uniref:hypothetical protein n=1 Tax=Paraoerskovia marina TaxID=545619 RepID=UPI000492DCCE|nr:hypothetical protein [Paraoerskovia marina]
MTAAALPAPAHVSNPARVLGAAAVLGAAVLLVARSAAVRAAEASLLAWVAGPVTGGTSRAIGDIAAIGGGTGQSIGVQITFMCSTVVLAVPLLVLGAVTLGLARFPVRAVLGGLGEALGIVLVANMVRYAGVLVAYQVWGDEGFEISHHLVGAVFVVAAFVVAMMRFAIRVGRPR